MFFFFLTFLSCPFQYLRTLLIKNIVFSNCARFCTPERCANVTWIWSWKTTIITRFLVLFCLCFCFYFILFYLFIFFWFCFVLFCFFNKDDDIQLQNKYKCPPPLRISYKCQFSGLVSSTQLFDLFTFSKLNFQTKGSQLDAFSP